MPYLSKISMLLILLVFIAGCKKSKEPSCSENNEITKKFQHGNLIKFQIMLLKSLKKGVFEKANQLLMGNGKVVDKCLKNTKLCSLKSCLKDVDLPSIRITNKQIGGCKVDCREFDCIADIVCKDILWELEDNTKTKVIIKFEKLAEIKGHIYAPDKIHCEIKRK
ncbi:hypothetical protein KKF34_14615 [Myxococcota bacterium]|nr:hypothetical protein [Myxococcota bacterium]MBU1382105.1 hypothetical protein [Myxococcota bacterium]MBU1498107.1 hypothetical protein [Myxococcota bacterium]